MKRLATTSLLVLALGGWMFAQDTPKQDPPPDALPPPQDPKVQLNNVTLEQFAHSVQRRTGKTFIYSAVTAVMMRETRIQFVSFRDFSDKDKLFALFQNFLQVQPNRLVLIDAGDDKFKIIAETEARRMGVKVVTETGSPNDTFVTRVFNLQYITAVEAFQALVNFTMPTAVVQFPTSGGIAVTDTDYNVKRMEEILKAVDVKKPDMIWRVVPLRKAVAAEVELMLRNLLQGIAQQQRQRPGVQPGLPGGVEQVTVVADRRTNSILMMAEPGRIDQVQQLVESLDKEPEFETSGTYIIPLRHRDANEIARILNGLYRISTDSQSGIPSGGGQQGTRPNQPIGPQGAVPQGGVPGIPQQTGQQTGAEPTIIPDTKTNSVLLVTDRNTYQMLARLTQRLDRRRPQVLIKASVVEVQASDTFDLGVELARAVDPEGTITTFGRTNMGMSTIQPAGGNLLNIVPSDTPGITLALLKDRLGNVGAIFKALKDKAKVSVIDEPEVATEDNGGAVIRLSSAVQSPVSTVTVTGIQSNGFQELRADTTLSISPHITQGGYLRLETEVTIEKFGASSAAGGQPPPKSTRFVKTPFLMPAGRTAVIGGIVTSDRTDAVTSVPVLGDIPVFGFLFRRTRELEVRRTLYIFITPYILYDDSFGDLSQLTQERMDEILFAQDDRYRDLMSGLRSTAPPDPQPHSTFRFPAKRKE